MAKLVQLLVVCCVLGCVLGSPVPKTVINAADNDVTNEKPVGGGGVAISAGATVDTSPPRKPVNPNLYNDIFNIPTSILNAVNRLLSGGANTLSNLGGGHGGGHGGGGGLNVAAGGQIGTRVGGGAGLEGGVSVGGGGGGAAAGAGAGTGGFKPAGSGQSNGFFNDIFNIPISALNAVNQLLNNNQKNAGK